ncbi:MAG: hypothetical protein ACRDI1_06055 [Actinomycetota bacterium]
MTEPKGRKGPRGTKSEVEAVKKTARKVSEGLGNERDRSLVNLAQTFGEINGGEALAQLDTRLTFIERQVERLAARREEMDRSVQGELNVMRSRIEEALTAVGATAEETKVSWVSVEKRLTNLIAQAERRSAGVIEAMREEVVSKVESASSRLEKYEARLRGEMTAFEDSSDERNRSLTTALEVNRDEFQEALDSRLAELDGWIKKAAGDFEVRLAEATGSFEKRLAEGGRGLKEMGRRTGVLEERLSAVLDELEQQSSTASIGFEEAIETAKAEFTKRLDESEAGLQKRIDESGPALAKRFEAEVESKLGDALSEARRATETSSRLESAFAELAASIEAKVSQSTAEGEGRVAQAAAEAEARVEARLHAFLSDVHGSQEGERREMEARLSEILAEARVEMGRLKDALEARFAKGDESVEALDRRILQMIRASEEKAAGAAVHLESMIRGQHRQVVGIESELSDQLGAVAGQLSEVRGRLDEVAGRVGTTEARWATDRGASQVTLEGLTGRIDLLEERLREAVEEVSARQATRVEMLASRVSDLAGADVRTEERQGAVEFLKRRVAEMGERVDEIVVKVNAIGKYVTRPSTTAPAADDDLIGRLELLEKSVDDLARRISASQDDDQILARLEELERRAPVAETILPQRRRWR